VSAILVLSTAPDRECARQLAAHLLESRLAACVNLLPGIESHYQWEGKMECSQEVLLLIKSTDSAWVKLRDTLWQRHPYECPEILRVDPSDGLPDFLDWIHRQTGEPTGIGGSALGS